jgi:hypothetical protein
MAMHNILWAIGYRAHLSFPNVMYDTLLNYTLNDVDFGIGKYAIIIISIIISIVIIWTAVAVP